MPLPLGGLLAYFIVSNHEGEDRAVDMRKRQQRSFITIREMKLRKRERVGIKRLRRTTLPSLFSGHARGGTPTEEYATACTCHSFRMSVITIEDWAEAHQAAKALRLWRLGLVELAAIDKVILLNYERMSATSVRREQLLKNVPPGSRCCWPIRQGI